VLCFILVTTREVIDAPKHMTLAIWYFLRSRPGDLRSLPRAHVDRFFSGGGRLDNDGGVVRYVEVVVQLEDRRAVEVLRVTGFQHRALADGTIDRNHLFDVMALAGEAASGGLVSSAFKSPPGVVDAEHRFAQRRLDNVGKWEPSPAELGRLRALVNEKAGRAIM
jgi:hypothetical protein